MWRYALDGIFSFSVKPLKVWGVIGVVISLLSFVYAALIVLRTLLFGVDLPGYASLIVAVLFLGGIQLIGIGVLGEYIGRIYIDVKRRPHYFIGRARVLRASHSRWRQGELKNASERSKPCSARP